MRIIVLLSLACAAMAQVAPQITLAADGPYRVRGNRIFDAHHRAYVIRGTRLPIINMDANSPGFGPFSGTTFITIRQRMNMNAVRLPLDARQFQTSESYRAGVVQIVQEANRFELLAILESADSGQEFWTQCAAAFKANPNVFFAVSSIPLIDTIRATGAQQPVIAPTPVSVAANVISEVRPSFTSLKIEDSALPTLVDGLDPHLDRVSPECAAFPTDPGDAAKLVASLLDDFDRRSISWTISSMEPGGLIDNYTGYDWTKLDSGWTCGEQSHDAGIAMMVLSHLWNADPHGLITVNQPAGGLIVARGANASAYGRILADREVIAPLNQPMPVKLGNISIRVTDSRGAARLAGMNWTGGGWSSVNLVIPATAAPGPAEVAVLRTDGSKSVSHILIADVAPGLWTMTYDGRGPVIAEVEQHFSNGKVAQFQASACTKGYCRAIPIPLTSRASTAVRIFGTGFRYVSSRANLHAFIDNTEVPVEKYSPTSVPGRDQVTIKIPNGLIARGETDLYITADGALSNVVRINCGESRLPSVTADDAQAQLGRYLFYDKRMSANGASSCATCHRQDLAFTDGRAQALGTTNQIHPRGSMTLVNVAYNTAFNWTGDPAVHSLEQQALKPMLSTDPVELGLNKAAFLNKIRGDSTYRSLFANAFPNQPDPFTLTNVARAIAAFERTITSSNSPYDRFHFDNDESAISESAKRGEILFYLDGGPSCFRCHNGFNFTDGALHNTGLANAKFKTPTLRNVALTFPYMHDGSIATLEEVIDHYAAGGRDIPGKDKLLHGFKMTRQNRADLVEFLKSLTDLSLISDPRYANPW